MVSTTHIQVSSLPVVELPSYELIVLSLPIMHTYILHIGIRPSYMGLESVGEFMPPSFIYLGTLIVLAVYINLLGYTCVYYVT